MKYIKYRIKITEHKTPVKENNTTTYKNIFWTAEIGNRNYTYSQRINSTKELIDFVKGRVYL